MTEAFAAQVALRAVVDRVIHDSLAGRTLVQPVQVFFTLLYYLCLLLEADLPILSELSVAWVAQEEDCQEEELVATPDTTVDVEGVFASNVTSRVGCSKHLILSLSARVGLSEQAIEPTRR